ncbi:nickel-type superoxide dismutase maturation protease [Cyanobacterium aponinum FACHB-4101]|uniref:nickel-type superoxide dismutase maturation protease n=1 Tax=Cyanobacterium aponinum TaxID=379064 RepID=UPI001681C036|nr:nickel-type superoxide dismutase maturation protease [Cyanobacterium aponinum]MBD2393918.1 nickel-type superoxide dismutase maturation protease [Cyanobacterium aponinum FACHB-4101]
MQSEIPHCSFIDFLLLVTRRRRRFRVTGLSMLPLLSPEEEIIVDPYYYRNISPQVNDIVIVEHPLQSQLKIVKRINQIIGDKYFIIGDNQHFSTDSRHFGLISQSLIVGKVIARFP